MNTIANVSQLYAQHLDAVRASFDRSISASGLPIEGVVIHAGSQGHYYADDREIAFHPTPHFVRFAPLPGKDHLLVYRAGGTAKLYRIVPRDFWYEAPESIDHPCMEALEGEEHATLDSALDAIGELSNFAFVGGTASVAKRLGVKSELVDPAALISQLDWDRAYKSAYEVECLREAARLAGVGHRAVRAGMLQGLSERELHASYLEATGLLEDQTPYTNIIGWDEHGAVLHYQSKDVARPQRGNSFLIDAGAPYFGYGSDVTRSYTREGCHSVYVEILDRMETLQGELVAATTDGKPYVDLHAACHSGVARILCDLDLVRLSPDDCFAAGLTNPFLPHGLGHHLGIQVHDVGGKQTAPDGGTTLPPVEYPFLRTTRRLEAGNVVTIEPGFYFIPMLLEPLRTGPHAASVHWDLVDELIPFGGVRIEDNIHVRPEGPEDLSRPFIPGHRD